LGISKKQLDNAICSGRVNLRSKLVKAARELWPSGELVGMMLGRKESMHIHIKSLYIPTLLSYAFEASSLTSSFGSAVGVGAEAETADTGGSGC
jgi:hypothetical protein